MSKKQESDLSPGGFYRRKTERERFVLVGAAVTMRPLHEAMPAVELDQRPAPRGVKAEMLTDRNLP